MSNVIEGAIDIDFLEVLTLTIDIELTIFESLTLILVREVVGGGAGGAVAPPIFWCCS